MISVAVNDGSQVAEARRDVVAIARQQGFNEVDAGRAALVATELATNLVKHARGGELLVGFAPDEDGDGIQILALDRGRGMANVQACLADAVRLFRQFRGHQVSTLIDYIHGGLRWTRCAAVSMARYDPHLPQVTFGGIGNVAGVLVSRNELRRMVSMPGTVGYNVRKQSSNTLSRAASSYYVRMELARVGRLIVIRIWWPRIRPSSQPYCTGISAAGETMPPSWSASGSACVIGC